MYVSIHSYPFYNERRLTTSKMSEQENLGIALETSPNPPCDGGARSSRASSILYDHHTQYSYAMGKIVFGYLPLNGLLGRFLCSQRPPETVVNFGHKKRTEVSSYSFVRL